MPTSFPPLVIPPRRGLVHPMRRPFNVDKDCVLCLLPEINTKWIDYSQYGNDGTINGATLKHNGRLGPTLYFDGVNDSVNLGTPANLMALTVPMTFELWVKFDTIENDAVLIDFNVTDADTDIAFGIYDTDDQIIFGSPANRTGLDDISAYLTAGLWYHWVIVHLNTVVPVLYLNGVQQTPDIIPVSFGAKKLTIGARNEGAEYPHEGSIDEVRIYDRALAAWEIQALYEQGKPG